MFNLLLIVGIILFILWILGVGTKRTFKGVVHIALVIAVILIIIWMLRIVFRVF